MGGDVLQGVEQRRLGPVDVVDQDDERTVARRDLEQASDGPVRLLDRDRAGRRADESCDERRDAAALVVVARQPRDRLLVDALGQPADDR